MCKVFTLLTNRPLFKSMQSPENDASEVDILLYQMITFCGEFFERAFLERCIRSPDYFQRDCATYSPCFYIYSQRPFYD
jgi:serine/threonine-protein kinase SRPK3